MASSANPASAPQTTTHPNPNYPHGRAASLTQALGNLVRLQPLSINDLPAHQAFPVTSMEKSDASAPAKDSSGSGDDITMLNYSGKSERPGLQTFILAALDEASVFIDGTIQRTFQKTALKPSKPATAKVQLSKRMISPHELGNVPWINSPVPRKTVAYPKTGEAWFARRSKHSNAGRHGTANYPEFDRFLRLNHSENEQTYTPSVYDSFKVLDWNSETAGLELDGDYKEITMAIYEMCHKLPWPLQPRVFPVLILTAVTGGNEFIVLQIPVDIRELPDSFYSNGRNVREGNTSQKRKRTVGGMYASIERCRKLPDFDVDWVMATASDAGGWLPKWAQKLGVPGAILHDVGLFMEYMASLRASS